MKHVLIFSTNYLPHIGGAEIAVKEITDRTDHNKFKFSLITSRLKKDRKKKERIGEVRVYRVGLGFQIDKWLLPLLGFFKFLSIYRKEEVELLWSIMASQSGVAAAISRIFKKEIPLLLTVQEGNEEEHLKRYVGGSNFLYKVFIRPWHILVFKKADRITAISSHLAERARENSPGTPVYIVPNGVDVERFSTDLTELSKRELREELGIGEDERIVITTSRLVSKNAIGDLITAMKSLPSDVTLLVVGSGKLRSDLEKQVLTLGLDGRVIFVGNVSSADIPTYLSISDVFCRPSISEGLGNSFIEAMAAGVPVVATPVGGIPDFLTDGETGLFAKVRNPESIAEAIRELLSDELLQERIVMQARDLVVSKYDWNTIAEQMEDIFNKTTSP